MSRLAWNAVSLTRQGNPVLNGVSLAVHEGEMIGLVGPNGAGKTAMLRVAIGLEKLVAGEVLLDQSSLSTLPAAERARRLAYLPQQAEAAWPITVAQAVALGRLPHGDRNDGAVARALDAVGMSDFADRPLTRLSGGERALVLLARALAVEAGLLLLDEPTANLDDQVEGQALGALASQLAPSNTLIVVTHKLRLLSLVNRVIVMANGKIVLDGPTAEVVKALQAPPPRPKVEASA
jgi:iron complex transport system ATP-binding protein